MKGFILRCTSCGADWRRTLDEDGTVKGVEVVAWTHSIQALHREVFCQSADFEWYAVEGDVDDEVWREAFGKGRAS